MRDRNFYSDIPMNGQGTRIQMSTGLPLQLPSPLPHGALGAIGGGVGSIGQGRFTEEPTVVQNVNNNPELMPSPSLSSSFDDRGFDQLQAQLSPPLEPTATIATAEPPESAITNAITAAHKKQEWKPKRITLNQPGTISIRPNNASRVNKGSSVSFVFRPRGELNVQWSLPIKFIIGLPRFENRVGLNVEDHLKCLNLGLFRRGVGTNQNAIITKEVILFSASFDAQTQSYRGAVPYYAPRSPGTFVFRLFYDLPDEVGGIVNQLGTSQTMSVEVQGRDVEPNLRFILSQFKAKKTSMAALHQLAEVFVGLLSLSPSNNSGGGYNNNNNNNSHGNRGNSDRGRDTDRSNDSTGRAAWGCLCESRKVLDGVEKEVEENETEIRILGGIREEEENEEENEEESGASTGAKDCDEDGNVIDIEDEIKERKKASAKDTAIYMDSKQEKKKLLLRKLHDVQVAVASVLQSACENRAVSELFRPDQFDVIRKLHSNWCTLTETFKPKSAVSLEGYQMEQLSFLPKNPVISQLNPGVINSLSSSAAEVYKKLAPSPEFFEEREAVRKRLELVVLNCDALPSGTKILVFGSSANGFGSSNSDLDMCISLPSNNNNTERELDDPAGAMGKLAEDLEAAGMLEVSARLTARIPIVMFRDNVSGLECDISMQNPLAVRNTSLLATYARADSRVRPLAYVMKKWVKARRINSPSDGTLSSYGYIIMLLHYLQTRKTPVIPNLQLLPPNWTGTDSFKVGRVEDVIMCCDEMKHPNEPDFVVNGYFYSPKNEEMMTLLNGVGQRNKESLGSLLAGFFKYYAYEFDYRKHVISLNGTIEKDLMGESHCWAVHNGLAIQDPFETFYCISHVVKVFSFTKIRREFALALSKIEGCSRAGMGGGFEGLLEKICEEAKVEVKRDRSKSELTGDNGDGGGGGGV